MDERVVEQGGKTYYLTEAHYAQWQKSLDAFEYVFGRRPKDLLTYAAHRIVNADGTVFKDRDGVFS